MRIIRRPREFGFASNFFQFLSRVSESHHVLLLTSDQLATTAATAGGGHSCAPNTQFILLFKESTKIIDFQEYHVFYIKNVFSFAFVVPSSPECSKVSGYLCKNSGNVESTVAYFQVP